ncbi:MAG: hypothetical protein AAGC93_24525 [Cyanobacteria bacterium P01_F01_bin.53]
MSLFVIDLVAIDIRKTLTPMSLTPMSIDSDFSTSLSKMVGE